MRALLAIVPCVLLLGISQGAAANEEAPAPAPAPPVDLYVSDCSDFPAADEAYCQSVQFSRFLPCTGSVDERLDCLEKRVRDQQYEMIMLRRALDDLRRPRVRPLTAR
jgi:hypothetical protein